MRQSERKEVMLPTSGAQMIQAMYRRRRYLPHFAWIRWQESKKYHSTIPATAATSNCMTSKEVFYNYVSVPEVRCSDLDNRSLVARYREPPLHRSSGFPSR